MNTKKGEDVPTIQNQKKKAKQIANKFGKKVKKHQGAIKHKRFYTMSLNKVLGSNYEDSNLRTQHAMHRDVLLVLYLCQRTIKHQQQPGTLILSYNPIMHHRIYDYAMHKHTLCPSGLDLYTVSKYRRTYHYS